MIKFKDERYIFLKKLRDIIEETLTQNKAKDLITIDISDKSNIADYMVIASGESAKHVKSLAEHIRKSIEKHVETFYIDGMQDGNWVVMIFEGIILHIFRQEVREYYNLEDLWMKSPIK